LLKIVTGLLNGCWTIVERFLKDFETIFRQLLNDLQSFNNWLTIFELLLNDCRMIDNQLFNDILSIFVPLLKDWYTIVDRLLHEVEWLLYDF